MINRIFPFSIDFCVPARIEYWLAPLAGIGEFLFSDQDGSPLHFTVEISTKSEFTVEWMHQDQEFGNYISSGDLTPEQFFDWLNGTDVFRFDEIDKASIREAVYGISRKLWRVANKN